MKKKILLLSDDLRHFSGVATMSREIVLGTVDKFDWVQIAGGLNHPEKGKIIDLNDDIRKRTGVKDANVKLYPTEGYGNIGLLRNVIEKENPDGILHFTDPHFWTWLYDNEYEIRRKLPIMYYHVWDNLPYPLYNRNFYESCDWIGCISKLTYGSVVNIMTKNTTPYMTPFKEWQVSYVPHGINPDVYKPLEKINENIEKPILRGKSYDFILYYNNRNIRRKMTSDVIYGYKLFCDSLSKQKSKKTLLLLHTDPIDNNGTDLTKVISDLSPNYNIKFTDRKYTSEELNQIYNVVDATINIAHSEGFGLTTAESLMAGTPIIVNVTGGLQDQCGFDFNEKDYVDLGSLHDKPYNPYGDWCMPIWPSSINLTGSVPTPYIYEDRVSLDDVASAIDKMYRLNKDARKNKGLKGREWMINNMSSKKMCDELSKGIEATFSNFVPKKQYEVYRIV